MSRLRSKVNADESCGNYQTTEAFRAALPWDEERVTYISERWDVSRNAARTLILKEIGKSVSEIADMLYLTNSTVSNYVSELADKIHVNALAHISYKRDMDVQYDVWGSGEPAEIRTTPPELVDPEFREPELPRNEGIDFGDIPKDLISSGLNVEVET